MDTLENFNNNFNGYPDEVNQDKSLFSLPLKFNHKDLDSLRKSSIISNSIPPIDPIELFKRCLNSISMHDILLSFIYVGLYSSRNCSSLDFKNTNQDFSRNQSTPNNINQLSSVFKKTSNESTVPENLVISILLGYSMLETNNLLGCINVAKSINTHQIWNYLFKKYIKIHGVNDFTLEIIDSRISNIVDMRNPLKSDTKNTETSDSSNFLKFEKDFHFNAISIIINHAIKARDNFHKNSHLVSGDYIASKQEESLSKSPSDFENEKVIYLVNLATKIHFRIAPYLDHPSEYAINILIWSLIKLQNDLKSAFTVYEDVIKRNSWNKVLNRMSYAYALLADGSVNSRDFNSIIRLTKSMENRGVVPNTVYYSILIKGLLTYMIPSSNKNIGVEYPFDSHLVNDKVYDPDHMDRGYKGGDFFSIKLSPNPRMTEYSLLLFNIMKSRNLPRTPHIYLLLMWAYSKNNKSSYVQLLFDSLSKESIYWEKKRCLEIETFKKLSTSNKDSSQKYKTYLKLLDFRGKSKRKSYFILAN
ncbi:hypothetical protein AYI68_g7534 [Smittium mucronatum]|uniref:Pentatricopeptide repeat-containing protein n=1 Tax=Smittium mucronatum TaxID=133383 RepID=A0A1R0GNH7_9FUNG|nr:hypothetical protein AYI68_g7534 [Smittium mucronatum]